MRCIYSTLEYLHLNELNYVLAFRAKRWKNTGKLQHVYFEDCSLEVVECSSGCTCNTLYMPSTCLFAPRVLLLCGPICYQIESAANHRKSISLNRKKKDRP